MLPALVSLKSLIKTKSYHIDLPFFRLHYQATVCLLLTFCLILTAKVLFGDTIDCTSRTAGTHDEYHDNLCYSIGTYSKYQIKLRKASNQPDNQSINSTFRVDPESRYLYTGILYAASDQEDSKIQVVWHNYYQYVPVILFIQAVLFYFPHYLWKVWENGVVSSICKRLHENRFAPSDYLSSNYDLLYFLQNSFKLNRSLVYKYYFCHLLCLFNLIIQIVVLNKIFNNQFVTYGYKALRFLLFDEDTYGMKLADRGIDTNLRESNLNSPMDFVFPKITACWAEFVSSAGGSPDQHEFMCVLPLNILHDKFFLLLWFWFLILLSATTLQIIQDSMFTLLPFFRRHQFTKRYGMCLWDAENRRVSSLPEIFLLDLIGQNTDKFAFSALLRKLNKDDDWSPSEHKTIV